MNQNTRHSTKKLKIIFLLLLIIIFLATAAYLIIEYKLNLNKINNNIEPKSEKISTEAKNIVNDKLSSEAHCTPCPEKKTANNNKIISILQSIKLGFISGNPQLDLINQANSILTKKKIDILSHKSIFLLLQDLESAKTELLKLEDISSKKSNNLIKKLYHLISSQFYVERLNINDQSTETEIQLKVLEKSLKKFNFVETLTKAEGLANKSKSFDDWLSEYQKFYQQIKIIETIESEYND